MCRLAEVSPVLTDIVFMVSQADLCWYGWGPVDRFVPLFDPLEAQSVIELIRAGLAGSQLEIVQTSWSYPSLGLVGNGWNFNTVSAWRVLTADGRLEFGWEAENVDELVQSLVGRSIIAVRPQSSLMADDPAFELSDGRWLEVFACHPIDPWVLDLPHMVYVGSPSAES